MRHVPKGYAWQYMSSNQPGLELRTRTRCRISICQLLKPGDRNVRQMLRQRWHSQNVSDYSTFTGLGTNSLVLQRHRSISTDSFAKNHLPGLTRGQDVSRVGMYGHSIGSATATASMLRDRRLTSGLNTGRGTLRTKKALMTSLGI